MDTVRVVAAAMVAGGRVLVARRGPDMSLPGRWEFPGGKVEAGETDEEALAREIAEELGVEVAVGPHLASSIHRGDVDIELVVHQCRVLSGRPVAREHAEIRWVTAAELEGLDWAPADVPLLAAVRVVCS